METSQRRNFEGWGESRVWTDEAKDQLDSQRGPCGQLLRKPREDYKVQPRTGNTQVESLKQRLGPRGVCGRLAGCREAGFQNPSAPGFRTEECLVPESGVRQRPPMVSKWARCGRLATGGARARARQELG